MTEGARTAVTASRVSIIVLVLATALIHFSRAVADPEIRVMFMLNDLGYLALGALLCLPQAQMGCEVSEQLGHPGVYSGYPRVRLASII